LSLFSSLSRQNGTTAGALLNAPRRAFRGEQAVAGERAARKQHRGVRRKLRQARADVGDTAARRLGRLARHAPRPPAAPVPCRTRQARRHTRGPRSKAPTAVSYVQQVIARRRAPADTRDAQAPGTPRIESSLAASASTVMVRATPWVRQATARVPRQAARSRTRSSPTTAAAPAAVPAGPRRVAARSGSLAKVVGDSPAPPTGRFLALLMYTDRAAPSSGSAPPAASLRSPTRGRGEVWKYPPPQAGRTGVRPPRTWRHPVHVVLTDPGGRRRPAL